MIKASTGREPGGVVAALGRDVAAAGLSAAAALVATRLSSSIEGKSNDGMQIIGLSLSTLLFPQIKGVIDRGTASLLPFTDNEVAQWETVVTHIIRSSRPLVEKMPEKIRKAVGRIDADVTGSLRAMRDGRPIRTGPDTVANIKEYLLIREAFWLGQPRICKDYYDTRDEKGLRTLVRHLPDSIQDTITEVINAILAASMRGEHNTRRTQVLIYGAGGTGKTTLVKAIARLLGAPLVETPYGALSYSDVTGEQASFSVQDVPGEESVLHVRGMLRDDIREAGKNPIVLLDEFSIRDSTELRWKGEAYRKLFNTDVTKVKVGEEDIGHATFFVLTNEPRSEFDAAFRSRFREINMPPLDDLTLARIAGMALKTSTAGVRRAAHDGIDRHQWSGADNYRAAYDDALTRSRANMSLLQARNVDPGARTLQNATQALFDHLFVANMREGRTGVVPQAKIDRMIAEWSVYGEADQDAKGPAGEE